jgi:hypothetical protein
MFRQIVDYEDNKFVSSGPLRMAGSKETSAWEG